MQRCGRYLKEKLPFGLISFSSFHLTPRPLQQLCTGHDTCFGLMKTDNEGLGSCVCIWREQKGDRGSRQLGGKSLCRAAVFSMLPSHCVGGTQKWGWLCFSSAGKPEFAPQHLKMLLSWMGLAVALLVVGVPSTRSSGGWVPSKSSRWMVVLGRKMESACMPEDSREKKREGKTRNELQPRRWPRSKKLEKGSNSVGLVKAKLFL